MYEPVQFAKQKFFSFWEPTSPWIFFISEEPEVLPISNFHKLVNVALSAQRCMKKRNKRVSPATSYRSWYLISITVLHDSFFFSPSCCCCCWAVNIWSRDFSLTCETLQLTPDNSNPRALARTSRSFSSVFYASASKTERSWNGNTPLTLQDTFLIWSTSSSPRIWSIVYTDAVSNRNGFMKWKPNRKRHDFKEFTRNLSNR